jgi:hypothetical protein
MDSIKAKASVTPAESTASAGGWERPTPKDGHDSADPKISADVQSTKLRQLLGKIKTS